MTIPKLLPSENKRWQYKTIHKEKTRRFKNFEVAVKWYHKNFPKVFSWNNQFTKRYLPRPEGLLHPHVEIILDRLNESGISLKVVGALFDPAKQPTTINRWFGVLENGEFKAHNISYSSIIILAEFVGLEFKLTKFQNNKNEV